MTNNTPNGNRCKRCGLQDRKIIC